MVLRWSGDCALAAAASRRQGLEFDADDWAVLRPILSTAAGAVAKATRCRKLHARAQAALDPQVTDKKNLLWHYKLWCLQSSGVRSTENEFAKRCLSRMINVQSPSHGTQPSSPKGRVKLPPPGDHDPMKGDFHSINVETNLLFAGLTTPMGYDEGALSRGALRLWPIVQPKLRYKVSATEVTKERQGLFHLMQNSDESNATDKLECLTSESMVGCLFSQLPLDLDLDGSNDEPNCDQMESTVQALAGNEKLTGSVHSHAPLQACTSKDIGDVIEMLTGKCPTAPRSLSDPELALVWFKTMIEALASYDLRSLDGIVDLYTLLHLKVGFPALTEQNKLAHKFLVPNSMQELFYRLRIMFLATTTPRLALQNGVLRATLSAHFLMGTLPAMEPGSIHSLGCHRFLDGTDPTKSCFMPLALKPVAATIRIPRNGEMTTTELESLDCERERCKSAADLMGGKSLHAMLTKMLETVAAEQPMEISYLAENRGSSEMEPKPLVMHFMQLKWIAVDEIQKAAGNCKAMQEEESIIGKLVEAILASKTKETAAMLEQWEKNTDKKKVNDFNAFKETHHGCESWDTLMVHALDGRCGFQVPKDANEILKNPRYTKFAMFLKKRKCGFNQFMGRKGLDAGQPSLPDMVRVLVGLMAAVWNGESLKTVLEAVKNNGVASVGLSSHLQGRTVDVGSPEPQVSDLSL